MHFSGSSHKRAGACFERECLSGSKNAKPTPSKTRGLCHRLEGQRGSMKINSLKWIIVGALLTCTIAYDFNERREQDIVRRCKAVKHRNEIGQLNACNGFLRSELGCLLPKENSTLDRSCLDKKISEHVYQSCINDQGFRGYPSEPKESNGRLVELSS